MTDDHPVNMKFTIVSMYDKSEHEPTYVHVVNTTRPEAQDSAAYSYVLEERYTTCTYM